MNYEAQVDPLFQHDMYRPVIAAAQYCARPVTPIQSGNVNSYLLYVLLVGVMAYLLGALGGR